jgi:ketosteroid isomerase-like protein
MDDQLAINIARTKIRDAYNTRDFELFRSVIDDGFIDFSDTTPCFQRVLQEKWEKSMVKYTVIIIEIRVMGDSALEYGWQVFELMPKSGATERRKERYADLWQRRPDGWRLAFHMTNLDVPMKLVREA